MIRASILPRNILPLQYVLYYIYIYRSIGDVLWSDIFSTNVFVFFG